uniref:CDC42 effector protein (Rho GTPase binding) 3 n=1 Tax=Poecilia formosa TaxID=48698 RepID=A0A087YQV2_POEFO
MPAKAPIYLKPISSKKGKKCRLRDILSPDMISPPLGDFRHTIHIGKGGERDAFGDMSFLQGKYELLPGKKDVHAHYGNQSEYLRAHSTSDASFAETPSPVLKNAISLPTIGGSQALTLPLISSTVFPVPADPLEDFMSPSPPLKAENPDELEMLQMDALLRSIDDSLRKANGSLNSNASSDIYDSFDNKMDFQNIDVFNRNGYFFELSKEKSGSQDSLSQITGSLLSLELDLGPSILDDVLNIMDKPA